MEKMFAVTPDSLVALQPTGYLWPAQCHAFVHWGLYGDLGRNQKDFLTFLHRLQREPLTEKLFKDCFRKSYKDMLFALRNYTEWTRHKVAGVRAEKGQRIPLPPPIELRKATEAEIGRIKGDALALAGFPKEAHTALTTAYRRGEREPALLAALGLSELAAGDGVRARKFLEAAAAGKAVRPRAYLELARLRLNQNLAQPRGDKGRLSAEQTTQVLEPLITASGQPPPLPEIYELMAETWATSSSPPTAGQLAAIEQGVKLFPQDAELVYHAANLRGNNGFAKEAHSLVRLGLRIAVNTTMRTKFEQLQTRLPPLGSEQVR